MKTTNPHFTPLFGASPSPLRHRARIVLLSAATLLLFLSARSTTFAGSATWKATPATGDWNTATNWTAGGPPNGSADTAKFDLSNTTGVFISANTEVAGIVFKAGASGFTLIAPQTFTLTISEVGATNNSGVTQSFLAAVDHSGHQGVIEFTNSATAGSLTSFTTDGSAFANSYGGIVRFSDNASGGNGTFNNNGGQVAGERGGVTQFLQTATAGNGTFTNNGGAVSGAGSVSGAQGGGTQFFQSATAGNGTFINNGGAASDAFGGVTVFEQNSNAGNAILLANGGSNGGKGGTIIFENDSIGGTARVEVFGNADLDISNHNAPGVAVGSIEGTGAVFLGAVNLGVGSNNLSTTFSGVIQDGGANGGTGGSLAKIGNGKLTLSSGNTYTGGTTIKKGSLLVKNKNGSATGTGPVQVNSHGVFGGTGKIYGAVTVGNGGSSFAAALLAGTANGPGTLTINNTLTFNSPSVYECILDTTTPAAGKVKALGVTINFGGHFLFRGGSGTLTPGTVFTVINNTSANPILGNFSNLPDGSTFTSNGNNFQVNYEGGDGNDLTLTVVP